MGGYAGEWGSNPYRLPTHDRLPRIAVLNPHNFPISADVPARE